MKKKKNALLRQITENKSESIVLFAIEPPIEESDQIVIEYKGLPIPIDIGTGFFVEPNKVVTTIETLVGADIVSAIPANCLKKVLNDRNIRSVNRDNQHQIIKEAKVDIEGVTAFDPKNNLVILKIAETGTPLPLENSETTQIDDPIYTLGYQKEMKYMGTVGTFQNRYKDNKWFQIKTTFYSGNGGGPVLNASGEVIGVLAYGTGSVAGDNRRATVATATSSNVLKELLMTSEKLVSLEQLEKYSRIRAYSLEAEAGVLAEFYDDRKALRCFNAALKLNPDLVEIYAKRGVTKARLDNFEGAFKDFDKMIQINPKHIFAYNNRATSRIHLGDEEGALKDLNTAIELDPNYVMAHINLGGMYLYRIDTKMDEGDIAEALRYCYAAIDAYNKALALDPKNRMARSNLKDAKRKLKEAKPRAK